MPADAIDGVKGSKPRFKSAREELPEINRDYLEARTTKLRAQAFMAETEAAQKREELIEKSLVARQAAFIFVSLRQSVLAFPSRYARQMVGIPSEHDAKAILTKAAHEFLTELADFSEKAISPDWLRSLEADGQDDSQPIRPSSGQQIKRERGKAKKRRKQKTETMRKLRANPKIA